MLFAAHISDGVLTPAWQAAGFALAAVLACLGAWRLRDEEIPRVALLTAAFFVSSLMHIPVGPTKIHLLLTGLVGIVLGVRAALSIPIGLTLQFFLFNHGGFWSLGVNACVMGLPALAAWAGFRILHRFGVWRLAWFRGLVAGLAAMVTLLGIVFCLTLVLANFGKPLINWTITTANDLLQRPVLLFGAFTLAMGLGWWASTHKPEFTLGFLCGGGAVLLTTSLNYLALVALGQESEPWQGPALIQFVLHLPLVLVEGLIVGGIVSFLAKVKPEMLP
jgi:cobalt/nickel transport system permease protein